MTTRHRLALRIETRTDWHVGSGLGRPGSVDRLVERDADGLPFVPAKTLTGILRDACELAASALDGGDGAGPWQAWVDHLFGTQPALRDGAHAEPPRRAALSLRPARLPERLRTRLACGRGTRLFRDALTFVQPGVAIDPRSGSAKEKMLRFVEMARRGLVLHADAELDLPDGDDAREAALALLAAGARLVRRLGGKRRRGAGRVQVTLDAAGVDPVEYFDAGRAPPPPPAPSDGTARSESIAVGTLSPASGAAWRRVPLALELETPVRAARAVTGNVERTLDFVPGTYLLPHVTRALGRNARGAILAAAVRVLPAYPACAGGRGRPAPRSWSRKKADPGLDTARNGLAGEDVSGLRPLRGGFVGEAPEGALAYAAITPMHRTHNVIEDEAQRPVAEVGGVYTVQAIPAGTVLHTELRVRGDVDLPEGWANRLEGPVRLGRSVKDGYGAARMRAGDPQPLAPQADSVPDGGTFDAWLLSDAILRDESLRFDATPAGLARTLGARLGAKLRVERAYAGTRRIDSWHVGWGRPRPSLVALAAGTCVRFRADGAIDADALARVEAGGIGERCAEGYGDVCFGHPLVAGPIGERAAASPPQPSDDGPGPDPLPDDDPVAQALEEAAWRTWIHRAAAERVASRRDRKDHLGFTAKQPPMAQLGALRDVVARLREPGGPAARTWIERVAGNQRRRDKWPEGARHRLSELVTDADAVWGVLGTPPALTEGGTARLKRVLWAEAMRALFDAAHRAHRTDLDRQERDGGEED